jgi:hypothetical protein
MSFAGLDVAARVADHRRLAGGAAGGVQAHALGARHREHAERIAVAQVLLGGEGKLRQVFQRAAVLRLHPRGVELLAVVRHVVVGMLQGPAKALELKRLQLFL